MQADSILDNQIEVKMIEEIEVCQLYGDLRFITYILPVLPVVVGRHCKYKFVLNWLS